MTAACSSRLPRRPPNAGTCPGATRWATGTEASAAVRFVQASRTVGSRIVATLAAIVAAVAAVAAVVLGVRQEHLSRRVLMLEGGRDAREREQHERASHARLSIGDIRGPSGSDDLTSVN